MNELVLLLALFAPAPAVKAPPVPAIKCGTYVMTWRGVDCVTHFHHDGFFACHWQGRDWHSRWKCEKGVLTVTEWPMHHLEGIIRWEVRLKTPAAGELLSAFGEGVPWKLTPGKAKGGDA